MKNYPAPFAIGDQFRFVNRHGDVTLEAVTDAQPIREIRLADAPKICLISWGDLEKIALITDQVRLQPVCGPSLKGRNSAFIRHATTDTAGWVRVVKLTYATRTPAKDQIAADLAAGRNRIAV